MLDNLESLTIIICTIIGTAIATVSTIFTLQKSFREHIKNILKDHDTIMRLWLNKAFERYYNLLNDKLESLELRIDKLEDRQ